MPPEGKPNCYECEHRVTVPGDRHSSCRHPIAERGRTKMGELFAIMNRGGPHIAVDAALALQIRANAHGIAKGWFNWPYNFDPVWLEACIGFENKITIPLKEPE